MKKFLKIELTPKGEVTNVEFINTNYELIQDEFDIKYRDLIEDVNDTSSFRCSKEFSSIDIDTYKGTVVYGFTEEPTTYYIDFNKNSNICDELINSWENKKEDFDNIIEKLYFQLDL